MAVDSANSIPLKIQESDLKNDCARLNRRFQLLESQIVQTKITATPAATPAASPSPTPTTIAAAGFSDYFNVQDPLYGAKGDGITDDTAAIAAAVAHAKSVGGGTVFFPAGDYLTGPITLFQFGVFKGAGSDASRIHPIAGGNVFEDVSPGFISRVTIEDLGVYGNHVGTGDGIHLVPFAPPSGVEAYLIYINRVSIYAMGGHGIYAPTFFSSEISNVTVGACGDNAIELNGGPGTTLTNVFVLVVPFGKWAFRIYGGGPNFNGCNGVNTGNTTVAANIAAANAQVIIPASMFGIKVGTPLKVSNSNGTNSEWVTALAVTATAFTADFTTNKTGPGIVVVVAGGGWGLFGFDSAGHGPGNPAGNPVEDTASGANPFIPSLNFCWPTLVGCNIESWAGNVSTTIATGFGGTGAQTVTPLNIAGIYPGLKLFVANPNGSNGETVTVTSVSGGTFTATFATNKTGPGITVTDPNGQGLRFRIGSIPNLFSCSFTGDGNASPMPVSAIWAEGPSVHMGILDGDSRFQLEGGGSWANGYPIHSHNPPFIGLGLTPTAVTTIAASITGTPGTFTVTPADMGNIVPGLVVTVANPDGTNRESVKVASIAGATFTALFTQDKTGPGITVTGQGGDITKYYDNTAGILYPMTALVGFSSVEFGLNAIGASRVMVNDQSNLGPSKIYLRYRKAQGTTNLLEAQDSANSVFFALNYLRQMVQQGNAHRAATILDHLGRLGINAVPSAEVHIRSIAYTIVGVTAATPIQITTATVAGAYGSYDTGTIVCIKGVVGVPEANGKFTVINVDANNFTLCVEGTATPVAGTGVYASGGKVESVPEIRMQSVNSGGGADTSRVSYFDGSERARLEFQMDVGGNGIITLFADTAGVVNAIASFTGNAGADTVFVQNKNPVSGLTKLHFRTGIAQGGSQPILTIDDPTGANLFLKLITNDVSHVGDLQLPLPGNNPTSVLTAWGSQLVKNKDLRDISNLLPALSGPPTGAAGGALAGTYPNPTLAPFGSHLISTGPTPASVTLAGGAASVVGTDTKGIITVNTSGTGGSPVVLTFASAYATAPVCVTSAGGAGVGSVFVGVDATTTTLTFHTNFANWGAGTKISYICIQ